jgi:hypothetical protein
MGTSDIFREFRGNLAVTNGETISVRYGEITAALNKRFRDTESKTANSLQVGSYGRRTAINGISDLDMLYIMPSGQWNTYADGGQARLLDHARAAISARYPMTVVKVDRLVVRVLYKNFHIEVQPVFKMDDQSYSYPDTYYGGSWKITKPRDEMAAMSEFDTQKNKNLRRLCKMARAWKNRNGVGMGGLLIDTLAHNFLRSTDFYDAKSYHYYDWMVRDFFKYLSERENQEYFAALGSGQRVRVKKRFQNKAKKAYEQSLAAIDGDGETEQKVKWRKIFGRQFPAPVELRKSIIEAAGARANNTEEFFEDRFPIDIRGDISIDCEITQDGFRPYKLLNALQQRLRIKRKKKLRFFMVDHNISGEFQLYWKVLNRGDEAVRRDMIRGQIFKDEGGHQRIERTEFYGDHIVDCAAVQNGVVVARDRIRVPIDWNEDE